MRGKLYNEVTPQYCDKWKDIGKLLGLPSGELDCIEAEWPTNSKCCCNRMLDKWLDVDTKASWERIAAVIHSVNTGE